MTELRGGFPLPMKSAAVCSDVAESARRRSPRRKHASSQREEGRGRCGSERRRIVANYQW